MRATVAGLALGVLALAAACKQPGREGGPCKHHEPRASDRAVLRRSFGLPAPVPGYSCNEGLFCDDTGPTRVCRRQLAAGEPCHAPDSCVRGFLCDESQSPPRCRSTSEQWITCGDAGSCSQETICFESRCVRPANLGEACRASEQCRVGTCVEGRCFEQQ